MTNLPFTSARPKPAMIHKWIWLSLLAQFLIFVLAVGFVYGVRSQAINKDSQVPDFIEFLLFNGFNIKGALITTFISFLILPLVKILIKKINPGMNIKVRVEFWLGILFSFLVGSKFWAYGTMLAIFYILPHFVPFVHQPDVSWLYMIGSPLVAIALNYLFAEAAFWATQ